MAQCTKRYTGVAHSNGYWGFFRTSSGCVSLTSSEADYTPDGSKRETAYWGGFSITIGDGDYIRPYSTMCKWFIKYV